MILPLLYMFILAKEHSGDVEYTKKRPVNENKGRYTWSKVYFLCYKPFSKQKWPLSQPAFSGLSWTDQMLHSLLSANHRKTEKVGLEANRENCSSDLYLRFEVSLSQWSAAGLMF